MAVLTPSGEFIHANEALTGMLGPVAGTNIRSVVHTDDLAELGQAWEDMGNGATQSATTWMRWRASDGRAIWGRLSLSFLRASKHRPATILLQLEDSTRAHHDELRLERLIQGRDEFVAAIAEDIRVPIGAVLDLTAQAEGDPVDLHRSVRRIDSQAREMASIVDDLIVSAGKLRRIIWRARSTPPFSAGRPCPMFPVPRTSRSRSVRLRCGPIQGSR